MTEQGGWGLVVGVGGGVRIVRRPATIVSYGLPESEQALYKMQDATVLSTAEPTAGSIRARGGVVEIWGLTLWLGYAVLDLCCSW